MVWSARAAVRLPGVEPLNTGGEGRRERPVIWQAHRAGNWACLGISISQRAPVLAGKPFLIAGDGGRME